MNEPENPHRDLACKILDDLQDGWTWDYPNTLMDIDKALDEKWKGVVAEDDLGTEDIDNEVMFFPMATAHDLKAVINRELKNSKHSAEFNILFVPHRNDWGDWVVDAISQRWLLKKTARTEKYYKWEMDEKLQKKPE